MKMNAEEIREAQKTIYWNPQLCFFESGADGEVRIFQFAGERLPPEFIPVGRTWVQIPFPLELELYAGGDLSK